MQRGLRPHYVWRKSSFSGTDSNGCLEVSDGHVGVVPVRDSKLAAPAPSSTSPARPGQRS
ncbi:hypothetical protein SDIAM26S_02398 [Streptomyces diastaticus subsp. diastaticus]